MTSLEVAVDRDGAQRDAAKVLAAPPERNVVGEGQVLKEDVQK